MDEALIIDVAREAISKIVMISAPILLIALTVGLLVSIFQTVTSIQEQTLAFVPKILSVFISILIFGPWMLSQLVELMNKLYTSFSIFILN